MSSKANGKAITVLRNLRKIPRKERSSTMSPANTKLLKPILPTFLLLVFSSVPTLSQISLGRFQGDLAHGLQGEVQILNDKQIRIRGFSYDGQGPAVWFMGMKNGTQGVYSADGIALPNHFGNCRNLQRAYRNDDITITLPRRLRVYDLEAFSVYCFQYCHNFGYVKIPRDIRIPPAPSNIPRLYACSPRYPRCSRYGGCHVFD
ncbi:Protein Skeletor, isoforms D/E [Orchesella cincta]|uniref:Protein Skeletor, isoforms D/E n=1 Tax=Orchesella cincta TaxID=48709 RepID=A0A1D2N3H4_ORCCI|nr:Protein Skeletor, isoforms D/E [Orchesella cincta]